MNDFQEKYVIVCFLLYNSLKSLQNANVICLFSSYVLYLFGLLTSITGDLVFVSRILSVTVEINEPRCFLYPPLSCYGTRHIFVDILWWCWLNTSLNLRLESRTWFFFFLWSQIKWQKILNVIKGKNYFRNCVCVQCWFTFVFTTNCRILTQFNHVAPSIPP